MALSAPRTRAWVHTWPHPRLFLLGVAIGSTTALPMPVVAGWGACLLAATIVATSPIETGDNESSHSGGNRQMTRLQTKPVAHARRYRLVQRDQWTGIAPEALDRVVRESDPTSGAVAQHPVDTRRPLGTLRDDQIRNAVRLELAGNPATAS